MKLSAALVSSISKKRESPPDASDHVTACSSGSVASKSPTSVPLFSTMLNSPVPLRRATIGGSFTLVMVTVTVTLPVRSPSKALSVTSYSAWSSRFGEALNVSTPALLNAKSSASFPERFDQVTPAPSGSVAMYLPTTLVVGLFSG